MDFEFFNGIHRGQHHKVGAVEEVHGVRIVVNAIEQVVILGRPVAIGCEGAASGVAARVGLGRVHTSSKLSQKGKIAPVQGQIIDTARIDDLTDGPALGFEHRRSRGYFHDLTHRARLEREIDHYVGAHVNRDARLRHGLESLEGRRELVTPDFDRREFVTAIRPCAGGKGRTRAFVGERNFSAVNRRPRGVGHRPQKGASINLSAKRLRTQEQKPQRGGHRQGCAQKPG